MNLLLGAATIGLILAPLALGVFLSYRVFHTLDLTADGAFGVGAAAVAALLVHGASPVSATGVAAAGGFVAGTISGLLMTRLSVVPLLAGVLTSTSLYSAMLFIMGSGNQSLASSRSLTNVAEQVGQRLGMPAEVTLLGTSVSGGNVASLVGMALVVVLLVLGLSVFLATDLGLAMRAAGTNPQMAKAVGIEVDWMVVLGLGVSNALVALSGAFFAQYQGFANVEMGIGAMVMGVASLMVGETLVGRRPLARWVIGAAVGALVFRLLVAGAVRAGLNPNALKLVTAILVLGVLVAPELTRQARRRMSAWSAPGHA